MKTSTVIMICVLLSAGAAGIGYYVGVSIQSREIALFAAVDLESRARIKNALQAGQTSSALGLLDAGMYQDMFWLQQFDSLAVTANDYPRQRNRAIKLAKDNWIKSPPEYLDPESNAYIEKICDQSKDCPKGEVRPKSPSLDFGKNSDR
jgi:hypothetical protein